VPRREALSRVGARRKRSHGSSRAAGGARTIASNAPAGIALSVSRKPIETTRSGSSASQRGTPKSRRAWPLPARRTAPCSACSRSTCAMKASRANCARAIRGQSSAGSAWQWPMSISRSCAACHSESIGRPRPSAAMVAGSNTAA